MPPKARAKAKAKTRAGVLRRPAAAAPRRRLRRPAGRDEISPWDQGLEVALSTLDPLVLGPGCSLVVTEGNYFGAKVKLAAKVVRLEVEQGELWIHLKAQGTDSEDLLKVTTANPGQLLKGHVCPVGCSLQEAGEHFVHCLRGRLLKEEGDEPWTRNLTGGEAEVREEDELAALRRRTHLLREPGGVGSGVPHSPAPLGGEINAEQKDRSPDKDTKKKKKKVKKKEKGTAEGRYPALAVQKDLTGLYGGTGLDPKEKVRRRILAKAQKFMASKQTKDDNKSSSSSSSSSTPTVEDPQGLETLFAEETKIRAVAERFPGVLTLELVSTMRKSLLTTSGEELEDRAVRPTALLYFRTVLARRSSGAQYRELLNIASALDCLLKGKVAAATDILSQRLKAQEAVCNGTAWGIAQRLEVPAADSTSLVARSELQQAQREDYADAKARWRTQSSSTPKGEGKSKGKGSKADQKDSWRRDDKREDHREKKGKGGEKKG